MEAVNMESMIFQVSAKTARLIGRENISDVDGALLELVKNGYDADADCVYVKYIMPFDKIPPTLYLSEADKYFKSAPELLSRYYIKKDGKYVLKDGRDLDDLMQYILSLCTIIVLDNGSGMNKEILQTTWMNIGTSDKENNIYSAGKNRIKTGAKGIGRFALDKLSLKTVVYTKSENDTVYKWELNWQQFDNAELLSQVKANLNECDENFAEILSMFWGDDKDRLRKYEWSTGTLIILSPIRTFWSEALFVKVNNNLNNLNPLGNVDKFDVIVKNVFQSKYDFNPSEERIDRNCYDYLIEATFDGNDCVRISLDRNEIYIEDVDVHLKYSDTDIECYSINEFWERAAFNKEKYKRLDFDGKQVFEYRLNEIRNQSSKITVEDFKSIGPFKLKLYYLKNKKSTIEIIKKFPVRKRKKLLDLFSGIKIYRDNFKVRPYGDWGHYYDWLNLAERVQLSPAAASHRTGRWRVSPNQIIGSVSISRIDNPGLKDSANREGMMINVQYDAFVELIDSILSKFEFDRQYVLREYAAWIGEKRKMHDAEAQEIYEKFKKGGIKEHKAEMIEKEDDGIEYTKKELKNAIITLGDEKEKLISTKQLMMVLSSSGVLAQTFSHEITRMETEFGSRGQQLRASIDVLLNHKPYNGDEDFNPYLQIEELDETDLLLSEWVGLIMESINKDKFQNIEVDVCEAISDIVDLWKPLLARKYIIIETEYDESIELKIQIIELHLLLNNFILNSSYYLEESTGDRRIKIKIYKDGLKIVVDMENNGPRLAEKYLQMPDETLEARETSKKDGTGLGLWIAKEAVQRCDGELHVVLVEKGYLLRATWNI